MRLDFPTEASGSWRYSVTGNAALEQGASGLRLVNDDTRARQYTNAQLDDYRHLSRSRFMWRPPLRLNVRARFSHPSGKLAGTAGFGFWNDPFLMTGLRMPALPRAIWFFYASAPSNIKLTLGTPGWGWKAATIDALRPVAFFLALLAPGALLAMNLPAVYRRWWPSIQRALHIEEAVVPHSMIDWHDYTIEWAVGRARFLVDGVPVLENAPSPHGPLGFVLWLDNQYLVVTPQGRFRWGLLAAPGRQWLEVDWLSIEPGPGVIVR